MHNFKILIAAKIEPNVSNESLYLSFSLSTLMDYVPFVSQIFGHPNNNLILTLKNSVFNRIFSEQVQLYCMKKKNVTFKTVFRQRQVHLHRISCTFMYGFRSHCPSFFVSLFFFCSIRPCNTSCHIVVVWFQLIVFNLVKFFYIRS